MNEKQQLSAKELQQLVEEISLSYFQWPFVHQATFNRRLRTTGGRYHLQSHNIDINPKVIEKYGETELIGVIKHELCHYHLHLAGKGYQHKDQAFKELLKKTGGSRFVQPLEEEQKKKYCYQCTNCQQCYYRKRQIDLEKYVCGNCRHPLKKLI